VSGLPREEGEFILGRVLDIARAARVPRAGKQCRPNLYILVNAQPQELLKTVAERNLWFSFGISTDPMDARKSYRPGGS